MGEEEAKNMWQGKLLQPLLVPEISNFFSFPLFQRLESMLSYAKPRECGVHYFLVPAGGCPGGASPEAED